MAFFIVIASVIWLVIIVLGIGTLVVITNRGNVLVLKKLPGYKPHMMYGNALEMAREPDKLVEQLMEWVNEHPSDGLTCIWFGPIYPFIIVYKPELIEVTLNSSKHITKSFEYHFLHPWLGTGKYISVIGDGSKWKTRRRLITPTFHFQILNNFIPVFEEQASILITRLESQADNGVFNIIPYVVRCALDIICITSMDSSPNAQQNAESPYFNAVFRMSELVQQRQTCPWLWSDAVYKWTRFGKEHESCLKILHDFTNKVIDERIAERAVNKRDHNKQRNSTGDEEQENENVFTRKRRLAFLDLLLEAYDNGEISREGIREEVDTFMFEGHDTTAAGITWALYLLGRHSGVQQQVCEEVDSFFEQKPEKLTVEDMKELRYLECVIKESQRIFPSVPFFSRSTTEDCYLDGYLVPKGSAVGVSTIGLHRNPEVWPAPLEFNPDRFRPENSQGRHPYAFVPFSAGPRNCIGQRFAILEEKIILAYIIHHFDISSTQSFDDVKTCAELITRPKEGIFVSLRRRVEQI